VAQVLGLEELEFLAGVEGTERRMERAAQHTAPAAFGKWKLAAHGNAGAEDLVRHHPEFGQTLLNRELCHKAFSAAC